MFCLLLVLYSYKPWNTMWIRCNQS